MLGPRILKPIGLKDPQRRKSILRIYSIFTHHEV